MKRKLDSKKGKINMTEASQNKTDVVSVKKTIVKKEVNKWISIDS